MTAFGLLSLTNSLSVVKNPPNFECFKDLIGYGTLPQKTCYFGYNITKGIVSEGCVWTCEQIHEYCRHKLINADLGPTLVDIVAKSTIGMTPIALISNLMLFMAFFLPAFRNNIPFIYLRAIAIIELIHNSIFVVPVDLYNVTTFMTKLIDTFKGPLLEFTAMLKAMLALSLAFERFLGVTIPVAYAKTSSRKLLASSFLFSLIMSGSCLVAIARNTIVLKKGKDNGTYYDSVVNMTVFRFNKDYWQQVIMAFRYVACILMLVFSLIIVCQLKRRNRRIVKMMGDENAQRELERMRKVCRFQLIEAVDVTFALVCQTLFTYQHIFFYKTVFIEDCTYDNHARSINRDIATNIITFAYDMTDIISHFSLFYLYLFFHSMFRTELKRCIKLSVGKVRDWMFNTTTVQPIKRKPANASLK